MKNYISKLLSLLITSILIISCNEDSENLHIENELLTNPNYIKSEVLETSSKEIIRNAVLETTDLLKVIYKNKEKKDVIKEIYKSSQNGLYNDNIITLNDLINFKNSKAYKRAKIPNNIQGKFKEFFNDELKKNEKKYPNLNYLVKRNKNRAFFPREKNNSQSQSFYDVADITFYIPYLINDDGEIIDPSNSITFVPAVIDSDEGLGYNYDYATGEFETVITNDDYANMVATVIIQPDDISPLDYIPPYNDVIDDDLNEGGTGDTGGNTGGNTGNQYTGDCNSLEPNTNNGYIRQVFIGHAKIQNRRQYDRWVSLSGNGGGSEIRIGRLDSRDQITIDSIGNISANQWDNISSIYFSRRNIRRGEKKWVGSIWHKNWECNAEIHEVLFGVYEEDTEGNLTFDATIKWKDEILFSVDVNIQNRSKDEIIRKWTREETEFFATNLLDQGGGYWRGRHSFSDRNWAIYDIGTNFAYTMPHRWIRVGNNTNF